jgi:hypothetical protein
MTVRQLLVAWGLAFAVVIGVTLALAIRAPAPAFAQDEIAVIGSSPTLFAVPLAGGGDASLLGDGHPFRRFAKERMTEAELLALLEQALDARVRLIFVEANPLLFDFGFAAHQRPCDGWKAATQAFVVDQRERLRAAYHQSPLPAVRVVDVAPAVLNASQVIDKSVVDSSYPLVLRTPCGLDRLKTLAERARAQQARIVLVLPPRSVFASARIGSATEAALEARAKALADDLGLALFAPESPWPNAEFIDSAHVNAAGRRHFLAALKLWWAAEQ